MAALIEIPSSIVGERKIEVQGITKEYVNGRERMLALQPIDLEVRRGEFLCIVGPSGCGKSTLLAHHRRSRSTLGWLDPDRWTTEQTVPDQIAY